TWPINESSGSIVGSTIRYMTDELGLSEIGLLGTSNTFGTDYIALAKQALAERDLEPVAEETYEPTATDLTQQVLAVKSAGADGVVNGAYPNPLAVQLKQFRQNGLSIPTFSGGATP